MAVVEEEEEEEVRELELVDGMVMLLCGHGTVRGAGIS